jgi:hypothetical protein
MPGSPQAAQTDCEPGKPQHPAEAAVRWLQVRSRRALLGSACMLRVRLAAVRACVVRAERGAALAMGSLEHPSSSSHRQRR